MGGVSVGVVAYADDLLLVSASVVQLQRMLNICYSQAEKVDIQFNAKESCLMKFGKNFKEELNNLHIGGSQIVWTDKIKHLGVYVCAGRNFTLDSSCVVRKFYAAANAIYSHTMNVHEMPRLCLFESFTLPLLTYGCDGLLLQGVH